MTKTCGWRQLQADIPALSILHYLFQHFLKLIAIVPLIYNTNLKHIFKWIMLAVLSRFFSRKFKRKRRKRNSISSLNIDNIPTRPEHDNSEYEYRENYTRTAQFSSILRTTAEVHSTNEGPISPNIKDNHFSVPQIPNEIQPSKSFENNFAIKQTSSSDSSENKMSRDVIEEVAEFYQNRSYPQTEVRILISKNVIIYILGTNHASDQCKEDVVDIIEKIQPESVLVELCPLRACGCKKHANNAFQTTPKFTFDYLRSIITQLGFLPAMIFFTDVFREHLVSEHSLLHYGGEFVAAMTTAQNIRNCRLVLADRPIEITVKRQASAMGNWRGLRVVIQVTLALLFKRCMKPLMINANRLIFEDPKTYEVLVFERDLYLTYSIQEAAKQLEDEGHVARIVAVLGQGHISGIQNYWGNVPSEFIPFIMSPKTVLDH